MAAISVHNLSKTYRVYPTPYHRLLEALPGARKPRHRPVHALRDVGFTVERGNCMGLVGSNGAGKSTLLKILTGTTFPTTGGYRIEGRVASLLELGAGFHHDFSGRENIFLNAAMLGLSRRETLARYREIVDFSELGTFIDSPIRTYSSGMVMRLAFSVAVAIDPDVMILDEVFAVGDMHFRQKCTDRIWSYKQRGKTMLFCSHSLYDVRQLCEQAIWLKGGRMEMLADASAVTNAYAHFENQLTEQEEQPPAAAEPAAAPESLPHIVSSRLVDPHTGEPRHRFRSGDDVALRVHVKNGLERVPLAIAIGLTLREGHLLTAHTTQLDGVEFDFEEGCVTLVLPEIKLLSGEYTVPTWLLDGRGMHRYHELPAEHNLIISGGSEELGMVRQPHEWQVEAVTERVR